MTSEQPAHKRPFIGMRFQCCRVYSRLHLNCGGTALVGRRPRRAGKATIRVSPTGSKPCFFTAE